MGGTDMTSLSLDDMHDYSLEDFKKLFPFEILKTTGFRLYVQIYKDNDEKKGKS